MKLCKLCSSKFIAFSFTSVVLHTLLYFGLPDPGAGCRIRQPTHKGISYNLQKVSKYKALVESQGEELSPLVVGASGCVADSAKNTLQVTCSKQDNTDYSSSRYTYEFWMTKVSLSLQKSVASEVLAHSKKTSGRQYTNSPLRDTFPDSLGTHFEVNG